MRQCAEDACIALGFINPGDVATMMARMKKALKLGSGPRRGLARCWTLYNLSWAVLALKAAFLMTRTTNDTCTARWCGSTRASKGKRAPRRPCTPAAMRKSPFTLALTLLAHAPPQPGCFYHTRTQALRAAGVAGGGA